MTPEEQQQVESGRLFYEAQIANVAREGANAAMAAQAFSQRLKATEVERDALKARIAELEKPKEEAPA